MTPYDIIKGAFGLLGILAAGEVPSGHMTDEAFKKLDALLAAYPLQGVDLRGNGLVLHNQMQFLDALAVLHPVPDDHELAMQYSLALLVAPGYGVMPSPLIIAFENGLRRRLETVYAELPALTLPKVMTRNEPFNIDEG